MVTYQRHRIETESDDIPDDIPDDGVYTPEHPYEVLIRRPLETGDTHIVSNATHIHETIIGFSSNDGTTITFWLLKTPKLSTNGSTVSIHIVTAQELVDVINERSRQYMVDICRLADVKIRR